MDAFINIGNEIKGKINFKVFPGNGKVVSKTDNIIDIIYNYRGSRG